MEQLGKFLTITRRDIVKGSIMAALTVIVTSLINAIKAGNLPVDWVFWKSQLLMGLSAGLVYLLKNFLTNDKDQFLKKDSGN